MSTHFQVILDQGIFLSINFSSLYIRVMFSIHHWFVVIINTKDMQEDFGHNRQENLAVISLAFGFLNFLVTFLDDSVIIMSIHYFIRWQGKLFLEYLSSFPTIVGSPGGPVLKNICLQCKKPGFDPWVGKIPWRRAWQPTPIFLPGKSHGQRSLAGSSPRYHKESDTTE